jgi:hypothetical protein
MTESSCKGVGGWLLLLCINLSILDPLANLSYLAITANVAKPYFDKYPQLLKLLLINGTCGIGLAVFSSYAGLSLWRCTPNAVAVAKRYLSAAFLYSFLSPFLPTLMGLQETLGSAISSNTFLNSALTMLYLVAWYQYLRRSKRVRATYAPKTPPA